jgi:SAM-dependent methyltransferase
LDVGAGAGDFVAAARALGWEAVGVEANEEAAGRAQEAGLAVVAGDAAAALASGRVAGPFDVVRFHHTLEHLAEPAEVLRAAAAATPRGGSLLVAVPNAGGVFSRWFGRYWYHWALPFHRSHFDVASLRRLLRSTGWRPRRVSFVSASAGVVRSFQWWLRYECGVTVRLGAIGERVAGFLLRPLIFLADVLGRGDNLIVEAEKP